jgi:hypothetical protein
MKCGHSTKALGLPRASGDDPSSHRFVERERQDGGEEGAGVPVGKPLDEQLVQPLKLFIPFAGGEQLTDALGQEAAGDERQHVCGGAVEPLGVVDHAQHRCLLRHLREEAENGQPNEEAVGRPPPAMPKAMPATSRCGAGSSRRCATSRPSLDSMVWR